MTSEQEELWERIQAYEPDDPRAAFPFSARLARDNDWSEEYAGRVVAEYRRFAFLAVAAGHPVSPSDAVDQAWHLHLLYTRSYWDRFCRETLRRPLHHEPTRGGATERVKFHDWYGRTLESYRRLFDAEPPLDIWPSARQRFGDDIQFVRVNRRRNWIIPKPDFWSWHLEARKRGRHVIHSSAVRVGALGVLFALGSVSCGGNPRAWPAALAVDGPTFLGWFVLGWAVVHGAAAWLRSRLRVPADDDRATDRELDPYGVAFLSDGPVATLNAAIVNLARSGTIEVRVEDKRFVRQGPLSPDAHPVERGAYEAIADPAGSTVVQLRESADSGLDALKVALKRDGLLVADARAWRAVRTGRRFWRCWCRWLVFCGYEPGWNGISQSRLWSSSPFCRWRWRWVDLRAVRFGVAGGMRSFRVCAISTRTFRSWLVAG